MSIMGDWHRPTKIPRWPRWLNLLYARFNLHEWVQCPCGRWVGSHEIPTAVYIQPGETCCSYCDVCMKRIAKALGV